MEELVLECLMPYINNNEDRNSVSLVSRKLYELDSLTRKHVTVHVHFAPTPSRLSTRFPNIESLTLKGIPFGHKSACSRLTPWIQELDVSFKRLKELSIRNMVVCNSDIELLARKRGKDLRVLKITKCFGFDEGGLMYVSKYCNHLKTLCLEKNKYSEDSEQDSKGEEKDGKWLHQLAMNNKVIESFHFARNPFAFDVEAITLLAQNCSESLVSLKIAPCSLNDLRDAFGHAIRLEKIDSAYFDTDIDFRFPPNMCCFGIIDLPVTSFSSLLPFANQLRELNLECVDIRVICQCFLFERCPNLEVLNTADRCGDTGLEVIGQCCKKLRKLTHNGLVTHMGLIDLAQGCSNLEYLKVTLEHVSDESMECIGTHFKNLRNFCMDGFSEFRSFPVDDGIQAMLMGCTKLERLDLSLSWDGNLTDVGMRYIGEYGHNLRYLSLGDGHVSDLALLRLSGCPKLTKLKLQYFPIDADVAAYIVFSSLTSLRYASVLNRDRTILTLTRPASIDILLR